MEINVRLDRNFTTAFNRMRRDYGDELARLNGFSDEQLSYTDFIDNFVDKATVADASIDGNANVGHKDIVSLENEMSKPHSKLLGFNKIFYEINKKYGYQNAVDWLQNEWDGHFYLHDAYNSSYKPYCFRGDTKILTKSGVRRLDELVGKQIMVLGKNRGWEPATVKHFGRAVLQKLTVERYGVEKEVYTTGNHLWFVEGNKARYTLSTDELRPGMELPYNTDSSGEFSSWVVKSVVDTGAEDDVYCAVVPGSQSFTLDGNLLTHNCFAYDIEELVKRGLYFIEGFNAQPPKHLITYTDFVSEFISWCCNRTSGAVGIPSFLIYSYYFWKKDVESGFCQHDPNYYRDQEFQRIIYKLNQPYLRGGIQSAFTNFSIFDRPYLEALFGGKEFPDGTFIIDSIDEIREYQKDFMRILSNIRSQNMMTFPVMTYALLRKNGKFVDEDFAKWCCEHNMKWADSNFFISDDINSLSNCCFDGSQKCLTKSSNGVNYMTFKELYNAPYNGAKKNFTIFHNGSWVRGKLVRLPKRDMYRIVTSNKKELLVTDNHIFPTDRGDKQVSDITTADYLLLNCRALNTFPEADKGLTYDQGYLIGMYIGDGSYYHKNEKYTPVISLSLNQKKYESGICKIESAIQKIDPNVQVVLGTTYNNVWPVRISSWPVFNFVREYVLGAYCYEKELNLDCLLQSSEFRKGILDGYYATDGGNSNRIYTTSEKLVGQIECLMTSLGLNSVIDQVDRTDEPVEIRGRQYSRNFPLYCIRWYENTNRRKHASAGRKILNNCEFFRVESIEPYDSSEEFVYCFSMENQDEPYFTLPNGVITHNCRLKSNIKDLGYFNSIGGTALEVGSVKVNTVNLARLAYENAREDYIPALKEKVVLCLKVLDRVRHIIKRNADKGLLPNYTLEILHLKSQYNTIGIIGLFEALQKYGYTYKDEFGYTYYSDDGVVFAKEILAAIHEVKDAFSKDAGYMINIEQIPGERAACILMEKDRLFFPNEAYELPLYGNQWIPLGVRTTVQEKVRLSAILDEACSGG